MENDIKNLVSQFNRIFPGVSVPPIKWNKRLGVTAGRVIYKKSSKLPLEVQLNPHLLTDIEKLRLTLLHELAHVADLIKYGNGGHGKTWKLCMRLLGLEPRIYHTYDVSHVKRAVTKVTVYCECRTHLISHVRARKIRNGVAKYRCNACNAHVLLTMPKQVND